MTRSVAIGACPCPLSDLVPSIQVPRRQGETLSLAILPGGNPSVLGRTLEAQAKSQEGLRWIWGNGRVPPLPSNPERLPGGEDMAGRHVYIKEGRWVLARERKV